MYIVQRLFLTIIYNFLECKSIQRYFEINFKFYIYRQQLPSVYHLTPFCVFIFEVDLHGDQNENDLY